MRLYLTLAIVGALLVATGVTLWNIPAGLVAGGVELVAGAYFGFTTQPPDGKAVTRR